MSNTPAQLLEALDYNPVTGSPFPKAALLEIISRKDEMIPVLLDLLEDCRTSPADYTDTDRCMLPTYATYLLAQFRETRAYRPIIALLELQAQVTDDLFGDSLVEDMQNIIACVFDGDQTPLRALIENPNANEYARGCAGLATYITLLHLGKMDRLQIEEYFRELFDFRLERKRSHAWSKLALISSELGFTNLLPLIQAAYEEDLCDPSFCSLADLETTLQNGGDPEWTRYCDTIDDAVGMMESWACFDIRPKPQAPKNLTEDQIFLQALQALSETPSETPRYPRVPAPPLYPGVTRNDPCPCQSGKKFKKCCGAG